MEPQTSVVIVHWNQPDSCVRTVETFLGDPVIDDVIVVDNGSTPQALLTLRTGLGERPALAGRWELIELGDNTGFGPGVNRGWDLWRTARATPFCAVAPHDALPEAGTLQELIAALEQNPKLGIVGADVGDGQRPVVDHVFGPISTDMGDSAGLEIVDYAHGTLFMITRSCHERVGNFDERYFAYCEEADQGLRAKRLGFDVGLLVGARVQNPHVNTPAPVVDYLKERNTVLLIAEHFGRRKAAMRFALTIGQLIIGLVRPAARGEYWSARARVHAIGDIMGRRWGRPPERVFDLK